MSDPYCFDANTDYYLMKEQGCKICSESNPLLNFFIVTCVTGVGTLFAMWFSNSLFMLAVSDSKNPVPLKLILTFVVSSLTLNVMFSNLVIFVLNYMKIFY